MGHPRGTHSRYVIGFCLIPLEICGVKNNSRRITYAATKGTLKSKEKRSKNDVMRIKEVKQSSPTPANVFYTIRQFEVARETES